MKKLLLLLIVSISLVYGYEIPTGSKTGTYFAIGEDISKISEKENIGFPLTTRVSSGSIENVKNINENPTDKFTLIQSDVLEAYKELALNGNKKAAEAIADLKVLFALYPEEIHFLTTTDKSFDYIHQIKDMKINIGPDGSGTAMTTMNLYKIMFDESIKQENLFTMGYDEALKALINKEIDVVVFVGGQPLNRLDKSPELKQYIKLLEADEKSEAMKKVFQTSYIYTEIKKESYKWLDRNVPTLAVKALMITFNYKREPTKQNLVSLISVLKKNKEWLNTNGHPKWKDISLELEPLPKGWEYYEPIVEILKGTKTQKVIEKKEETTNKPTNKKEIKNAMDLLGV